MRVRYMHRIHQKFNDNLSININPQKSSYKIINNVTTSLESYEFNSISLTIMLALFYNNKVINLINIS